jgi:hypothetical protein
VAKSWGSNAEKMEEIVEQILGSTEIEEQEARNPVQNCQFSKNKKANSGANVESTPGDKMGSTPGVKKNGNQRGKKTGHKLMIF